MITDFQIITPIKQILANFLINSELKKIPFNRVLTLLLTFLIGFTGLDTNAQPKSYKLNSSDALNVFTNTRFDSFDSNKLILINPTQRKIALLNGKLEKLWTCEITDTTTSNSKPHSNKIEIHGYTTTKNTVVVYASIRTKRENNSTEYQDLFTAYTLDAGTGKIIMIKHLDTVNSSFGRYYNSENKTSFLAIGMRELYYQENEMNHKDSSIVKSYNNLSERLDSFAIAIPRKTLYSQTQNFENGVFTFFKKEDSSMVYHIAQNGKIDFFFTSLKPNKELSNLRHTQFKQDSLLISCMSAYDRENKIFAVSISGGNSETTAQLPSVSFNFKKDLIEKTYNSLSNETANKIRSTWSLRVVSATLDEEGNYILGICKKELDPQYQVAEIPSSDVLFISINRDGNVNWSNVLSMDYGWVKYPLKMRTKLGLDGRLRIIFTERTKGYGSRLKYTYLSTATGQLEEKKIPNPKLIFDHRAEYVLMKDNSIIVRGSTLKGFCLEKYTP